MWNLWEATRYLVLCEMLPLGATLQHQLAYVVEDTALAGETPHVTVLDCVSAARRDSCTLNWERSRPFGPPTVCSVRTARRRRSFWSV